MSAYPSLPWASSRTGGGCPNRAAMRSSSAEIETAIEMADEIGGEMCSPAREIATWRSTPASPQSSCARGSRPRAARTC